MIEVNRIALKNRATGSPSVEFQGGARSDAWAEANVQLRKWAKKPVSRVAGDQVEYEVIFLDGMQLRGLITIQADNPPDIVAHLRKLINSKAGAPLPAWAPRFLKGMLLQLRSDKERRYCRLRYDYRIG